VAATGDADISSGGGGGGSETKVGFRETME
jgi:hypothetical protein